METIFFETKTGSIFNEAIPLLFGSYISNRYKTSYSHDVFMYRCHITYFKMDVLKLSRRLFFQTSIWWERETITKTSSSLYLFRSYGLDRLHFASYTNETHALLISCKLYYHWSTFLSNILVSLTSFLFFTDGSFVCFTFSS